VVARHPEVVLEAVSRASSKRVERTGGKPPRRKAS
jgi:hypothetical protein